MPQLDWGRVVAAVVTAIGYALTIVLASPDWKLGFLLLLLFVMLLAVAGGVVVYNRKQDERIVEAKQEADAAVKGRTDCQDELRAVRTGLAILALNDRRGTTQAVMRVLLGEDVWQNMIREARSVHRTGKKG